MTIKEQNESTIHIEIDQLVLSVIILIILHQVNINDVFIPFLS